MQTVARSQYLTIKTEGAILPADLLQRLAEGKLDGLKPEQYHLSPNERLNEAITRAWNRCQGVWQSFQEQRQKLAPSESGTSLTRERWLLILFQELGYGRLTFQAGGLEIQPKTDQPILTPTTRYPISHVWEHVPIHLLTFHQELDKRDPASKRSPHSLMQEFLTRSEDHLWGMVSNGLTLRVLRDNVSLTRAAYLEFDLEAMMSGDNYADFSLLWLVCHQSRMEIGADPDADALPSNCWLEIWSQEAAEQGTRALETLRDGVREAISALGRGFLAHPANTALRQELTSGTLNKQDYYRQLLRLVYRLIFLFVAEDRDLLLHPEADSTARQRYRDHYSVGRMRRLAGDRRGGPHPDLYRAFRLVCGQLRAGYPALGLPALGSFLFSGRATPALDGTDIANEAWLNAIRALAFTLEGQVRRPVDYKNLGTEELGSVYESLLELHPQLNIAAATFTLDMVSGSERKTTGSYYTPASLINSLLDTALEPVVADRLQTATQHATRNTTNLEALSQTLLAIRVVDPACGSGHFLIAAARRLARHLARIQTGDDEPGPAAVRHALREVVGHCIYGVDINEMSVELCKVGLWLETLDPGKPLNFLDKNIQCGNSLIGTTPALLAQGIPDEAFTPITGDDKSYASEYRKQNSKEKGQLRLFGAGMQPWQRLGNLAQALLRLDEIETETLAGVAQQENAYTDYMQSGDYAFNKLWADAWCAAYVWRKQGERATPAGFPYPITESVFRQIERNPHTVPGWIRTEIERLAGQYQFLHWYLAFPQVFRPREDLTGSENLPGEDSKDVTGWTGGFDVVLGNPPWERVKLQEKEWFAQRRPEIANAANAAQRRKLIEALPQDDPALYADFLDDRRKAEGESHFIRNSSRYPLCGRGDINTYTIFAELSRHVLHEAGRVGVIVPSGIATDDTTKYFFQDLMDNAVLVSLYDFENQLDIFPGVHKEQKFSLLTLTGEGRPASTGAEFAFFAHAVADLHDVQRCFTLSAIDIALLNPNTRTCPIFRSKRDAELTKAIYQRVPVLIKEGPPEENPWNIKFFTMFHMSNDSELFRTREQLQKEEWILTDNHFVRDNHFHLPLYEGKLTQLLNHRSSTFEGSPQSDIEKGNPRELLPTELQEPKQVTIPRYWVFQDFVDIPENFLFGFHRVANPNNERSAIFFIMPRAGASDSLFLLKGISPRETLLLCSICCSFPYDFVVRQKVGSRNFSFFIVKQIATLPPYLIPNNLKTSVIQTTLELTYTAYDLQPFAQDCGYFGPPFRWDEERRFLLRCELDAAYFHLYGIQRDDVAYIMDTFPIVRRKDEAAYGEYRTKRVILEFYDAMSEATRTGQPYQTRLDPPPADPRAAHPWDETYLGPYRDPATWWREITKPDETPAPAIKEPVPVYQTTAAATLTLQPPPAKSKSKVTSDQSLVSQSLSRQSPLLTDFTPPKGERNQRLKQVMALANPKNTTELQSLVATLGDEDESIRWLAGSSLSRLPAATLLPVIRAFIRQPLTPTTQEEVRRVLRLLSDLSDDKTITVEVENILAQITTS